MSQVLAAVAPEYILAQRNHIHLDPDTVHVWTLSLEASDSTVLRCVKTLSSFEKARMQRFLSPMHGAEYALAHGMVRHLLGLYCDLCPTDLDLSIGPAGKPTLASAELHSRLSFNLSHSGGRALLAVANGGDVGADLERIDLQIQPLAIARRYFFDSEIEAIVSTPPDQQLEAFFRHWVAKEAVLKAAGLGLGYPLDRFGIRFSAESETAVVYSREPERIPEGWRVGMLPCEQGWSAAIVCSRQGWKWKLMAPDAT